MTKRILVVWYSRGGTTSKVASLLAKSLGADLDPIEENAARTGVGCYIRSALEAVAKGLPAIRTHRDPEDYDLVVVGTPVWVGTLSSPVRSYLYAHKGSFKNAAFFAVMSGRGGEDAVNEMRFASGTFHAPTTVLLQRDVDRGRHVAQCDRFVRTIQARLEGEGRTVEELPGAPVDFRVQPLAT